MRPLRALTALTFGFCTLGAQAADVVQQTVVYEIGRPGQASGPLDSPRMPVGALAFAAIGGVFLFRRGRAPVVHDVMDRD